LNIVYLEDSFQDFEIIRELLIDAGYDLHMVRVEREDEFASRLRNEHFDVILADFKLPGFDAFGALKLSKKICPDVPFICVSGSIGEETAIELIKLGAVDYVLKDRSERLPFAIRRALGEAEEARARRQAEEALLVSEERYRSIFENVVEGIFQTEPEGHFISVNPAMARIHGFGSPEEMIKGVNDIGRQMYVDPEDRKRYRTILEAQGAVTNFEARVYRADGSVIWTSVNARAVKDATGAILYYEGTAEDITVRRNAEKDVLKEREKLQIISNNAPFGLVLTDRQGRLTYINDRFTRLFGYDLSDAPDIRTWFRKAYPDAEYQFMTITHWVEGFNDAEPGTQDHRVFTVSSKDGTQKVVNFILSVLASGERLITCEDITEIRHLESQLRQAQKMESIGTLAGGIAHDFNNILTALMGYASLIQMNLDKGSPLWPFLNEIISASRKAADLIRNLLTFSRKQPVTLAPLDINDTIRVAQKLLKRLLTEDIELRASNLTRQSTVVMADRSQIDQVLFNLATNARDAMPGGGMLTIETATVDMGDEFARTYGFGRPGRYVLVGVSDTGEGMDEATLEKIFDPFFTTKETGKGTGLGLATVYGIVKQHDGYITVHSETGHGTTFHIYLPAMVMTTVQEERDAGTTSAARGSETILVAEDNEEVRHFILDALRQYGYRTIEAADGEDAIEKIMRENRLDLIVVDSVMPKKNGREVYEEARKKDARIKAIFISGYTKDVILEKGIREGEFDFVAKPLVLNEFLLKVREVLDR